MKRIAVIREYIYMEKSDFLRIILFMIYAFICGTNINIANATGLSLGEFILFSMTDHYYVIYGFFFYGMYWIFKDSKEESYLEIIRYASYNEYYLIRCLVALVKISIFVSEHILIAGIIGAASLDFSFSFNGLENINNYNVTLEIILLFKEYFSNAGAAVISVGAFLVLGMFFIYEILFYIRQIKGNSVEIITMLVILVNVMTGFKSHIDETIFEVFFINNYFILHHSLFLVNENAVVINIIIMIAMSVALNRIAIKDKKNRNDKERNLCKTYVV